MQAFLVFQADTEVRNGAVVIQYTQAAGRLDRQAGNPDGIANTGALLALRADAPGGRAGRDNLSADARDLRAGIHQRQEVFVMGVSLAELRACGGEYDTGLAQLRALADDATKRTLAGLAFEAKLTVQRALGRGANRTVAHASRRVLEADARKAGYG